MRETIGYNKTKDDIEEFIKLKPNTNIKGKVTVQLVDNQTKEVVQEVFTENIRMKWLDSEIYLNGISSVGCLWDLMVKYAGESTSSGKSFARGSNFKYILLYSSEEEEENEKKPSIDGTILGYCEFDTSYVGVDTKKGSFNQLESNIKNDSDGNLVMHSVYDFPTHACNGSITHIGYGKVLETSLSYYSYTNFGTNWQCIKGLPSPLTPSISSIPCTTCSWNCYHVGKNVFRFVLRRKSASSSTSSHFLVEVDIATGVVFKNIELLGYDNTRIGYSATITMIQMSKDGSLVYVVLKDDGANTNIGATASGFTFVTLSSDTGKILSHTFIGNVKAGGSSYSFNDYCVCVYEEGKNLYIYGSGSSSSTNYLSEVDISNKTVVQWKSPFLYSDSDNTEYDSAYRGALTINEKNEIVYTRSSQQYSKNHLIFDKATLALKGRYNDNKDKPTLSMRIIGNEGLAIAHCNSVDDSNSNTSAKYTYWGIFDRRKQIPMTTLTKLPSPVLKTAAFTMKVQYDVIFEMPNLLEEFIEKPV